MHIATMLAGLCPVCLINREDKFKQHFLAGLEKFDECYECHQPLLGGAYLHWDVTANCFSLLCIPCSEKAIATAGQYRGTEFGYAERAQ